MNLIQALAPAEAGHPGKPAAATLGLVDVDIHPRAHGLGDFRPWLSERWWRSGPRAGRRPSPPGCRGP